MIELPTERSAVTNYNPKLIILFGKPKSGKSSLMASLDNNLIIDLEDGYRSLSVMKVQARKAKDFFEIEAALKDKMARDGHVPYKFITIDNATRLEEMSLEYAAGLYRNSPMGKGWGYKKDKKGNNILDADKKPIIDDKADVRQLPNGSGYLYLRIALKNLIDMMKPYCETLILVAHTKDKQIKKNNVEMTEMSVDLAGKLSDIICGESDAIGYVYRNGKQTIITFEGGDDTIREARPLHLRGKRFVVAESDDNNNLHIDMSQIFIN